MSGTVLDFLNVARSQLGTIETPVNRTKYGAWFGLDGNAWCDQFVSWVAAHAGCADAVGHYAYTPSHASYFRTRGQLNMTPAPGALVFFQWADSNRICHVGIVEAVRPDGRIVTIEGNAQPGEAGDQSDGGGVRRRVRALTYVKGFGHPAYASQTATAAEVKTHPTPPGIPQLKVDGDRGPLTVGRLQQVLNDQYGAHLVVDNVWGRNTAMALQRALGVTPDGDFGRRSTIALQARLGVRQDADWGGGTTSALQARLNTGRL